MKYKLWFIKEWLRVWINYPWSVYGTAAMFLSLHPRQWRWCAINAFALEYHATMRYLSEMWNETPRAK